MHIAGYGDDDGIGMPLEGIKGILGDDSNAAIISHGCHRHQGDAHLCRKEDGRSKTRGSVDAWMR